MAEIKSSIELAMERTKGLTFTEEERRKFEEEREGRAAQALVQQFLKGDMGLRELQRKREALTPSARRALDRALVEALVFGHEALPKVTEALEAWLGRTHRSLLQRLRDLSLQWGQVVQKRRKSIKKDLREELAKRGIRGSAVEPNVEASPLWDKVLTELHQEFSSRLAEIQRELLLALEGAEVSA